jgi:(p)ppGpp synthase/HD superfamily hydrolase
VSITLTNSFNQALEYAAKLHLDQKRKGTDIPYMAHLLATAVTVMENGQNEDEVIAALLHDAAEDAGGRKTLEIIRNKFGDRVAYIVEHCSDTFEKPKPPWEERKKVYIEGLRKVEDPSILLVSIADKLHNARSILRDYNKIGEGLWERFNASRTDILCYYIKLHYVYLDNLNDHYPELVEELGKIIEELNYAINKNLAR